MKDKTMLSEKELAIISNTLQIPVVVADLLARPDQALDDETHYALHEVLSEMQPDSALLAIALTGKRIAGMLPLETLGVQALESSCESVLREYAPLWLDNAQGSKAPESDILELLAHLPEDLEVLGGLLNVAMHSLRRHSVVAAEICAILKCQAHSHALIAETMIEALEAQEDEVLRVPAPARIAGSNVILFPLRQA